MRDGRSVDGPVAPDYDLAMRSTWRRAVLVALAVVSFLAPVGGAAMVPDPTWIPGLYDGGDADEILLLIWDGTPAVVTAPPVLCAPRCVVVETAAPITPASPDVARAAVSRAPPLR